METNPFIKRLRSLVLEHYTDEQFGVKQLSEHIGLCRSQLHRKLKSITGQSISQFIREVRLDESLKLLQDEDLSASEVSYKVGFNSPSYFNTCFHNYFGYTPGEVRHKLELAKAKDEEFIALTKSNKASLNKVHRFFWLPIGVLLFIILVFNFSSDDANSTSKDGVINHVPKTIAVLPLDNWSGDTKLEFISYAITDEIISKLSSIEDMERVIPFTTIEKYKDSELSIQKIANELKVAYVLEGNIQLINGIFYCKVKLIDAENNTVVWSEEYSDPWESKDIISMEANIAKNLVNKLMINVTESELNSIEYVNTKDTDAYMLYSRGNYLRRDLSLDGYKNAINYYKKAIALDSTFFLPYLAIADSYGYMGSVWGSEEIDKDKTIELAKKYHELAVKYVDSANQDHLTLLNKQKINHDAEFKWKFESIYKHLMELESIMNSGDKLPVSLSFGFDMARKFGKYRLAIKIGESAGWHEKEDGIFFLNKAQVLVLLGETDKARALLNELDPLNKNNYFYLLESAKIYYYLNDINKSRQQMERFFKLYDVRPSQILWLAAVHAEIGEDIKKVDSTLNMLIEKIKINASGSPAWFLAMYYCHSKEYDEAFKWLAKSYELREVEMTWLKEEPLLRPLKNDPRYIELYNKVGFAEVVPINPNIKKDIDKEIIK